MRSNRVVRQGDPTLRVTSDSVRRRRGQASNPILALRGEGKNEDVKSRPGRADSLRRLSNGSCSRTLVSSTERVSDARVRGVKGVQREV